MTPHLDFAALVDRVTERTSGTRGDPLTRDEVEVVVLATFAELARDPTAADVLGLERLVDGLELERDDADRE